ncbi:MAG: hypothetical protein J6W08_01980 [Alphaproteobacteria bacterium]|nr:hypothetical protein [Alphaproteobacteria bacterium]MBR0212679.1 hypothetical protein [Alphaproteobacteria bacterium]
MRAKKKSWLAKLASIFFRPKHFFTRIVADGKIEDAMLNAFLWGLIGGILVLVTNLIRGDVFTIYSIFKAIVIYPVLAVILLFIFAGLMMLVSEIASGDRDWEIAVKGIASIFFVYPLALLLNAFVFDCVSMWTVSIIIDLYMAFLLYNIAVYCMHGKRVSVMFVVAVCLGLLACLYMSDYKTVWILIKNLDAYSICMF